MTGLRGHHAGSFEVAHALRDGQSFALGRLPALKSKAPYDPRFTEDKIGIWVPCGVDAVGKVQEAMRGHGAEEIHVHV